MRIGFKRGSHWYSRFIHILLCSEFSHAAIEVGGRIYESTALKGTQNKAGVRDYVLTASVAADYEWFDLGGDGDAAALRRYESIRGHGYDFFSLLSFFPFIRARDSACEYCYEAAAIMLGHEVKSRITPEILMFNILKKN